MDSKLSKLKKAKCQYCRVEAMSSNPTIIQLVVQMHQKARKLEDYIVR